MKRRTKLGLGGSVLILGTIVAALFLVPVAVATDRTGNDAYMGWVWHLAALDEQNNQLYDHILKLQPTTDTGIPIGAWTVNLTYVVKAPSDFVWSSEHFSYTLAWYVAQYDTRSGVSVWVKNWTSGTFTDSSAAVKTGSFSHAITGTTVNTALRSGGAPESGTTYEYVLWFTGTWQATGTYQGTPLNSPIYQQSVPFSFRYLIDKLTVDAGFGGTVT